MGCDQKSEVKENVKCNFNPRIPMWDATCFHNFLCIKLKISIHASQCGMRQWITKNATFLCYFNPRIPMWDATAGCRKAVRDQRISIHASQCGMRRNCLFCDPVCWNISIHASQCGMRHSLLLSLYHHSRNFNPRIPMWDATAKKAKF